MSELNMRPMTSIEFDTFRSETVRGYAAEQIRAGNWTVEEGETRAATETDSLLPQGVDTPGMLFLIAENTDGVVVGLVWVALEHLPGSGGGAWIYDIRIEPEQRGKGYGRALLRAAEEEAARHGVSAMGLNVFGSNMIARNLYESAGYQITSTQMRKELQPHD